MLKQINKTLKLCLLIIFAGIILASCEMTTPDPGQDPVEITEQEGSTIKGLVYDSATQIDSLPGDNYVIATYNGNDNYTTAEIAGVYPVERFNTQIIVNTTNITYGENEIINVTVDSRATDCLSEEIAYVFFASRPVIL